MSNDLLKNYHDRMSRMVGFPGYEPLGQKVFKSIVEEPKKKKTREQMDRQNEYNRKYRANRTEEQKEHTREYMREYYWKNRDRIRGYAKKYYDKKKTVEEETIKKPNNNHVEGSDYSEGYVKQLKHQIKIAQDMIQELRRQLAEKESEVERLVNKGDGGFVDDLVDRISGGLIAQNKELWEENHEYKEKLEKIKEAYMEYEKGRDQMVKFFSETEGDLDQLIMNR